jgi:peptidoglycan hydrolase CwlO-like protein
MLYDLANLGVSEDFLYEVEESLQPGKSAVVAEVWEEWTLPVDTRMEALGGTVIRRTRSEFLDAQMQRDIDALKADLAELEAERDQANGEAKAKLQKKIDATRGKLQAAQDAFQARIEASQKETEAKIQSLQAQADRMHGEQKAKREARITELKAEQERRKEQLKKSLEETKKAMVK